MRVVVEFPAVVEAMVKSGVLAGVVAELEIERREYGEVVPMPIIPVDDTKIDEVACATPASSPTRKLPLASWFVCGVKPKSEEEATWYQTPLLMPASPLQAEEF
jgi:hypothetical protein